jgi:octaheme c-type cytochrome (tetrathionate reductase family)
VGYGWTDNTFDFTNEGNVDSLACHDTTGTYKKFPTAAGHPTYEAREFPSGSGKVWNPPDLSVVAQNVGPTSRTTCGACHFYGGGGDGVKHGDMDSSLISPNHDLDVHMDVDGLNFSCTTCHTSDGHKVMGSRYSMNSTDEETCETCHTNEPHDYDVLNQHIQRIACQTCHIPEYARGGVATKMWWDWSKAGELNDDGSLKIIKDEHGHAIYDSRKGEFELAENVTPEYIWFNGEVNYTLLADTFDDAEILTINPPQGNIDDNASRIWPMKVFRGIQPYDPVSKTLVIPHLFGKDEDAYWKTFNWDRAIAAGMAYAEAPYSGAYDFIETQMYWPITHMVAPADKALTCQGCHVEEGGHLDFVALGYTEEQAHGLTHFPPTARLGTIGVTSSSPEECAECHEEQVNSWMGSHHGDSGVGCVSCHTLEGDEKHPEAAYSVSHDSNVCGACHLDEYHDWEKSNHANLDSSKDPITCVNCHEPHTQGQKIPDGALTSCDGCHTEQTTQMHTSTHAQENVTCLDCHKVTEMNTGHTFLIQADSCTQCHGEEAHTANELTMAGANQPDQIEITEESKVHTEVPTVEAQSQGANVKIPTWGYILIGLFLGVAGFWVVKGKEPGISAESMKEESNGE